MSMSDEEFEGILRYLKKTGGSTVPGMLRARDTAQREALARVEAERDAMEAMVSMLEEKEWAEHASKGPVSSRLETCITTLMNELSEANERADEATVSGMAYAEQRDTAQAQLAEAVGLLTYCAEWCVSAKAENKARDFVARHAQAEQQEAPIPEYFQEACDKFDWTPEEALRFYAEGKHFDTDRGRTRILDTGAIASNALKHVSLVYLEMKGDAELSELRAALATQAAAGEPVAIANRGKCAFWVRWTDAAEGLYGPGIKLYAAPPAAAHGDEAVRNLLRQATPYLETQLQETEALFDHSDDGALFDKQQDLRNLLQRMRAQGDGGNDDD